MGDRERDAEQIYAPGGSRGGSPERVAVVEGCRRWWHVVVVAGIALFLAVVVLHPFPLSDPVLYRGGAFQHEILTGAADGWGSPAPSADLAAPDSVDWSVFPTGTERLQLFVLRVAGGIRRGDRCGQPLPPGGRRRHRRGRLRGAALDGTAAVAGGSRRGGLHVRAGVQLGGVPGPPVPVRPVPGRAGGVARPVVDDDRSPVETSTIRAGPGDIGGRGDLAVERLLHRVRGRGHPRRRLSGRGPTTFGEFTAAARCRRSRARRRGRGIPGSEPDRPPRRSRRGGAATDGRGRVALLAATPGPVGSRRRPSPGTAGPRTAGARVERRSTGHGHRPGALRLGRMRRVPDRGAPARPRPGIDRTGSSDDSPWSWGR